jgi:hypothetical protein
VFVTAQGSAATRFKRAIERRSILNAELAAREMGKVSLEEALQLVVLYTEQDDPRAERAMVRWLGRLLLEKPMAFDLARADPAHEGPAEARRGHGDAVRLGRRKRGARRTDGNAGDSNDDGEVEARQL